VLDQIAYAGVAVAGPLILPQANRIAPINHVHAIPPSVPVLFLSGTKDERACPSEAQALCDRVAGHARLALFAGAGHGHLIREDKRRYGEVVTPLIREIALKGANSKSTAAAVEEK
jgi:pimeloyl-ACP methyl ester carboxylesterase